jgi:hypothetical protein
MVPGRDLRGRTPSFLKLLFILMNLFTARNSSERALRHRNSRSANRAAILKVTIYVSARDPARGAKGWG